MKDSYLVSIIIPFYNAEKTIGSTLESVCKQTYKNIEVIAVNDGSSDGSLEVLEKYNKQCNIIVISQKNSGVSVARNVGIENAKGKYITFVDSDDVIEEHMIEKLVDRIRCGSANLAVCGIKMSYCSENKVKNIDIIPDIGYVNSKEQFDKTFGELFDLKIYLSPWGKIYDTSIIKKSNIRFNPKISIGEDMLFNYAYLRNGYRSVFVREPLYIYKIWNKNSLTKDYKSDRIKNNFFLLRESIAFLDELNIRNESAYISIVKYFYVSSVLVVQGQLHNRFNCKEVIKDIKIQISKCKLLSTRYRGDFELAIYQWAFNRKSFYAVWIVSWLRMWTKRILR